MTENPDKPPVRRYPDSLGYDTLRPFHEVVKQMAEDAIAGRHQDAVNAELEAVRKRWRPLLRLTE